jgi:hypothetical protein
MGAFGRASTGSAPRTKPGALPNGLKKQLRARSTSILTTLEPFGRGGGGCKNELPRGSAPPFASLTPDGPHRGTAVAGAREGGWQLQGMHSMDGDGTTR